MIKVIGHTYLGPILYHSEPSDVPYSQNQFLGWDFFCRFLQQCGSRYDFRKDLAPLTPEIDGAINRTFFFVTNQSRLKVPCCATNLWVAKVNHFLPWFFSLKATHINFDTLINRFLNLTTIWRIYYKIGKKFCRF